MADSPSLRVVAPAALLLLVLATLTLNLLSPPPTIADTPMCGEMSALPVQPLGIAYPAFTLDAFGRSSVNLAPGDTLCLALGWTNGPGTVEEYRLRIDVQKSPDSRIGAYVGPLAGPQGWESFFKPVEYYAITITPDASPGAYNLVVTVLLDEQSLRDPVAIGVIQVVTQPQNVVMPSGGSIEYEGELQPQPVIPTEVPDKEDA